MIGEGLQKAIYAALTAEPPLAGGHVYDRVPASAEDEFPRITIGDAQVLDDGNSCSDSWEVYSDIHLWSRPKRGSKLELKALAAQAIERLRQPLEVPGFVTIEARLETEREFTDPDGVTFHGIVTMLHVLDQA